MQKRRPDAEARPVQKQKEDLSARQGREVACANRRLCRRFKWLPNRSQDAGKFHP